MDKKALLEQFEQTKTYDLCKSWQIDFDEKAEIYYSINPAYHNDVVALNAAWSMFQEQQAKVEELQKQNAWLSDVAERENKRANKLKEEHVSTTILLGKVEQQKAELQKRVDAALKETQFALQYVEEDMRGNHEFLQMAMIRTFKALEQALKGEGQ
ncbi:Uncharacterised protein [Acinetobacter pittii]|nr:Uncharacterised protein [Acinetobacter pittii]